MTLYAIKDGPFYGHLITSEQLAEALPGMQASIRARCSVVAWESTGEVPADEMLERLRRAARAEMVTIPPVDADTERPPGAPCADDVDTQVVPV